MTVGSIPYGGQVERVGDLEVVPVFDGYAYDEPIHMYGVLPENASRRGERAEDWVEYSEYLGDDGRIEHAYGGFLIRTAGHFVLIDTGVGPTQIGPYGPYGHVIKGGEMPTRLRELGVDGAEITDVLLSHLHPDHYGWAVANQAGLFPNATFRCHSLDWDHYMVRPGGPFREMWEPLLNLEERLRTWDHDGPILPGIDAQLAPGHTPGSTIFVISSGMSRCVVVGDVVHCPIELLEDEWITLGDVDPKLANRTKAALARELEANGAPVAGPHFPGLRFGRLLPGEGRRRWVV
jgi:glyoxylase-like metal-dependent hydrolase (beta-lactamase superfamily II)